MRMGDHIRDSESGGTGRVVAIFSGGAWAKRWAECFRCDAVDKAVYGYSQTLGNYDDNVYLVEFGDRSVGLVRERCASISNGSDLPAPSVRAEKPVIEEAPRGRRREGRRPKCIACGGEGRVLLPGADDYSRCAYCSGRGCEGAVIE